MKEHPQRINYGSEGLGFESLRLRRDENSPWRNSTTRALALSLGEAIFVEPASGGIIPTAAEGREFAVAEFDHLGVSAIAGRSHFGGAPPIGGIYRSCIGPPTPMKSGTQ